MKISQRKLSLKDQIMLTNVADTHMQPKVYDSAHQLHRCEHVPLRRHPVQYKESCTHVCVVDYIKALRPASRGVRLQK